jgi:hypothetical protein
MYTQDEFGDRIVNHNVCAGVCACMNMCCPVHAVYIATASST